jgi:hypothetical protein
VQEAGLNVTNVWVEHGLTGAGQIIAHADSGLDSGVITNLHPDFAGRVIAAYGLGRPGVWNDPDGHGTHTAGSAFGSGAASAGLYRGVAWEASIVHQSLLDPSFGLGGIPPDINDLFAQAYADGARIHTDSWGASVFGSYTLMSRQADEFMWDHPDMLLLFAAGNDGWDFDGSGVIELFSMAAPGTAKNLMTVGASENFKPSGSGGFSSFTYGMLWPFDYPSDPIRNDLISTPRVGTNQGMAAFSSRGPTSDGRTKPDVIAPGTDIISVRSRAAFSTGWGTAANTNYVFNGGTSMSTPLVAGSAALVRQYLQERRYHAHPSAALVKASLIHGARTLAPGQYGTNATQEIPWVTPNPVEGWGQVNVEDSLFPAGNHAWTFIDEAEGLTDPGDHTDFVFISATGTVRITLTYTDFPASLGGGKKLVNDLDLVLTGPGGYLVLPGPNGMPDRSNNIERIDVEIPVSGTYTARVEAFNVPEGPQPFALVVSGPISAPPVILHEPLANTFETAWPYQVEARVVSLAALTPGSVTLHWNITGSEEVFSSVAMSNVSNNVFTASIPAQPMLTTVSYVMTATSDGLTTRLPATGVYSFDVTTPVEVVVSGSPGPIFTVDPPYGLSTYASGTVVRFTAPAATNVTDTHRMIISGWSGGTGDIPATGATHEVEVTLREDSAITWAWTTQYALVQTSTVVGLIHTATWWNAWSTAVTVTATSELVYSNMAYGFAGWNVDGVRQPNAAAIAANPASGLLMFAPRMALADYRPATQDSDGDGIPDWWESFYFGIHGTSAFIDSDMDGFTNLKEYQDRTHPLDSGDTPQPPAIAHIPLSSPRPTPAPWKIDASIIDNHAVNQAAIVWNRNGGNWTTTTLFSAGASLYTANLPAPGTNSDSFFYRIEATDFAGLKAVSGPFFITVAYPRMNVSPLVPLDVALPAAQTTNLSLVVTNDGLANLAWTLERTRFFDPVETGTGTWIRAGQLSIWHIRGDRFSSASNAWHFGNGMGNGYPNNANASLIMEPVTLDAPASFHFDHWARMEYDADQMDDHYWDGGIVEISIDDGESFEQIFPVGGYPHRITANPASPFLPETPCYGETDGWEAAEFDLSAYVGETVQLRFRFGSDQFVRDEGWYIDNIKIVYQQPSSWTWLAAQTNNILPAAMAGSIPLTLDTTSLEPGETQTAVLILTGNDPKLTTPFWIPVRLHNLTRELVVTSSGPGQVDPSGVVYLLAGDSTNISITADTHYEIRELQTNGVVVAGFIPIPATNFVWSAIESNAALHVRFEEILVAGLVPEWWLYQVGLTNQPLAQEALTDHDGDGMLTWQEFFANTDPLDAGSVALPIVGLVVDDLAAEVEWLSFTNTDLRYRVMVTTNLTEGFFPLLTNLVATPPVNVATNENGVVGFRFYRIETEE